MKNISFDNPYLLLIFIPVLLVLLLSYFLVRNKDNRSFTWALSLGAHIVISLLVLLAAAGLAHVSLLSETTVYVVADVSHSSERNLDEIDAYIAEIKENLPERTKLGVVCFGRNFIITTQAGRQIVSVKNSGVDDSSTDIAGALAFTEGLFPDDVLKRIVLITDGNDTVSQSSGSIASTVERLTENGVAVDAIFLDNTLKEGEEEIQLLDLEYSSTTYLGQSTSVKVLIRSSALAQGVLELFVRQKGTEEEFAPLTKTVVTLENGLTTASLSLPADASETYEYRVLITSDKDTATTNNERFFMQTVVGKKRVLHISGKEDDLNLVRSVYGESAEIDEYLVKTSGSRVPFMLEELVTYDEILLSSVDVRNIRNANAFIDSVDMAVSQYGKSLLTMGDLSIQTNKDDALLAKLSELLPVSFGSTRRDGRLYTIVLDVSHSMYMASKLTTAKNTAVNLISILDPEDYICFIEFSGDVKVKTPKKLKDCKEDLVSYIQGIDPAHGTDIGLGLEEALKTITALNLTENQVMLISDGFSFRNQYDAVEVAAKLKNQRTIVSTVCTYIPAEGDNGYKTLDNVALAGGGKSCYKISRPEDVSRVVFGEMSDDIGATIIEKDAALSVTKHNDPILKGIDTLPTVSGFILSMEKYDATTPISVTYQKDNGYQETVPFYAWRSHGNGRIASFAGALTGAWAARLTEEDKTGLLVNLFEANLPTVRVDRPFTATVTRTGKNAYVEIAPSILNPAATAVIRITYPNGRSVTRTLAFDSKKYSYFFAAEATGAYTVEVTYSYDERSFTDLLAFDVPYTAEYDEFAVSDRFTLYAFMRGNGEVKVGEIPSLAFDENAVTTYRQSFAIPLLFAAAVIFVLDIFVRKLKRRRSGAKR